MMTATEDVIGSPLPGDEYPLRARMRAGKFMLSGQMARHFRTK